MTHDKELQKRIDEFKAGENRRRLARMIRYFRDPILAGSIVLAGIQFALGGIGAGVALSAVAIGLLWETLLRNDHQRGQIADVIVGIVRRTMPDLMASLCQPPKK